MVLISLKEKEIVLAFFNVRNLQNRLFQFTLIIRLIPFLIMGIGNFEVYPLGIIFAKRCRDKR